MNGRSVLVFPRQQLCGKLEILQNRMVNSRLSGSKKKEWIMVWKSINCLPGTIGPTDIIPCINRVFHKSYGSVNSNLKALTDRGWNPPNQKTLEHKDLTDDSVLPIVSSLTNEMTTYSEQSITLNIH